MTIEIEGTFLDTEDGITTVTADVSHVIGELELLGYTVNGEERHDLDLVDSLLFGDIQEKFLELNCTDRERLHSIIMNFK